MSGVTKNKVLGPLVEHRLQWDLHRAQTNPKFRCVRCGRTAEEGCAVGYWEAVLRGDPEAPALSRVAQDRHDAQQALAGADIVCRAREASRDDATHDVRFFIDWCEVTSSPHERDASGTCVECGVVA